MRPYWAIIVDSFRESLNSKVLWCLLGLITVLLLAIAPLGVRFSMATNFHRSEIDDLARFAKRLEQGSREDEGSPRHSIWAALSPEMQEKLTALGKGDPPPRDEQHAMRQELASEFNNLLKRKDLISDDQRATLSLSEQGREILAMPEQNRTESQTQRLNRLTLAACYPGSLPPGAAESMRVTYLGINASDAYPVDRQELETGVKMGLAVFMNGIAAPLGVFAAILVTASIIPNMFNAGSVNLLFSKPINRALLYLAKFFGGCWFVLINATYLILGLWFLLGVRLGIWHEKLLWVVPVLTFLFAVYYSVSAFAGIVWRNTIMAVVVAIMFWAVCFGVGFAHDLMEELLIQPQRITHIVPAGDALIVVNESGGVSAWQDGSQIWQPVFDAIGGGQPPVFARRNSLIGPLYDPDANRILAIHRDYSRSRLIVGYPSDDWKRERLDSAPSSSIALLAEPKQTKKEEAKVNGNANGESTDEQLHFLVVDRDGISRIVNQRKGPKTAKLTFLGKDYAIGPKRGSYESVGPKAYDQTQDAISAVLHPADGSLYLYAPGQLDRLTPTGNDRKYGVSTSRKIFDDKTKSVLAAAGDHVLIASEEGGIELLNATTLETKSDFPAGADRVPRFAVASPNGRYFGVLFHNRTVWCYDAVENKDVSGRFRRQSHITGLVFNADHEVLVASDPPRVQSINLASGAVSKTWQADYPLLDSIHYYAIRPLYRIFPKPGRLKQTAEFLMTEKSTAARGRDQSLGGSRVQINPWKPVWQSAIFMGFMLAAACAYIQRQEL